MPAPASIFLTADHLVVVGITVIANVALCRAARRNPTASWIPWFTRGLAILQLVNLAAAHVYLISEGRWDVGWALPCQLCDAAIAVSVLALLKRGPLLFELSYFWGLGGALQGLITPAIDVGFPHPAYVQFFVVHVGLVTAALFLAFGLGMRPRPHAVARALLWTNACALAAGLTNWLTGGNYMFLRDPPPTGSLLDLLGEWPWYLVSAEVVALIVFSLLAVPFRVRRVPHA